jgi:hypothetical protein
MRRTTLLFSAALLAASSGAGLAMAGDRYGPPEPVKPNRAAVAEWTGPLLGWSAKAAPESTDAPPAAPMSPQPISVSVPRTVAQPNFQHAPVSQSPALPNSIYAPPPAPVAPAASASANAYQPSRPTGEVLTLSLADLPPPGPSLERQQAAEEDAAVLAAKIARADAQAVKDIAAGRPVTGGNTDLLGGP